MDITNFKLTIGATLTGLLLIAAGSVTGISTAAADGPDVAMPGAQAVGEVQLNGTAGPTDLMQTMKGQPVTTYPVFTCTSSGPSDQIFNPTVTCTAAAGVQLPTNGNGAATNANAATFTSSQIANVVDPQDVAIVALPALQAVSSLR
jgi:hypothetical protein